MAYAPKTHRACEKKERRHARDEWRGASSERGYDRDWLRVAAMVRERDGGLCQHCLKEGGIALAMEQLSRTKQANIVDHIMPLHVRPDWRLEMENCQTLCRSCHAAKTHRDNQRYGSATRTQLIPAQQMERHAAQMGKFNHIADGEPV